MEIRPKKEFDWVGKRAQITKLGAFCKVAEKEKKKTTQIDKIGGFCSNIFRPNHMRIPNEVNSNAQPF